MNNIENFIQAVPINKCCICDNVLSVAPIAVIPEGNTIKLRCGRCKDIECETAYRIPFYEDILKHLSFPCIYKNCDKMIGWKEVEEHEKNCEHKTISCPVYYQQCFEVMELSKLERHFTEKHRASIEQDYFCVDVMHLDIHVGLALIKNEKFLVFISHDFGTDVSLSVFSLSSSNKIKKYSATLSNSADTNFSVSYNNLEIMEYNEKKCCFKCFEKSCEAKDHVNCKSYPSREDKYGLSVNLKKYLSHPDSITFTINFLCGNYQVVKKNCNFNFEVFPSDARVAGIVRRNINCPGCFQFLLIPIYCCQMGHSICNTCKTSLNECPLCKQGITKIRVGLLENLVESIDVPCPNEKYGCWFVGKVKQVRKHEEECEYKCDF